MYLMNNKYGNSSGGQEKESRQGCALLRGVAAMLAVVTFYRNIFRLLLYALP